MQHAFEAVCEHLKIPKINLPSLNISTNEVNPNKLYNDELIAIDNKDRWRKTKKVWLSAGL